MGVPTQVPFAKMSIRRGNREGGIQGGGDKFSAQRKLCYFYVVIPPEDHALSNGQLRNYWH